MRRRTLIQAQWLADIRRFHTGLAVWYVTLLLDLVFNLREPSLASQTSATVLSGVARGMIVLFVFGGGLLLPALAVMADSPARRDKFLSTRPMPPSCLGMAKVLFILICVVLPLTLSEMTHLVFTDWPLAVVLQGTLERFLLAATVAAFGVFFAALWPNLGQLAIGATIAGVAMGAVLLLSEVLARQGALVRPLWNGHTLFGLMVWLAVAALLLAALDWLANRRHWGMVRRGLGLAAVSALAAAGFGSGMFGSPAFRPLDPRTAERTVRRAELEPYDFSFQVRSRSHGGAAQTGTVVNLLLRAYPPGGGRAVAWRSIGANFSSLNQSVTLQPPNANQSLFRPVWHPDNQTARAWASFLPPGTLLLASGSATGFVWNSLSLGVLNDMGDGPTLLPASSSVDVEIELRGDVFQWRKVGDVPVVLGQEVTDSSIRMQVVDTDSVRMDAITITLRVDRVALATSRIPDRRRDVSPQLLYTFLLYDPVRRLAVLPQTNWPFSMTQGWHTAVQSGWHRLVFQRCLSFGGFPDLADLSHLRLLVLRKDYLGTVTRRWRLKRFLLSKRSGLVSGGLSTLERLSRAEFHRRLAEWKPPSPNTSRAELGRYLYDLLRLVEARGYLAVKYDPLVRELARFVPTHLDLLMEAVGFVGDFHARRLLIHALTFGLEEKQKGRVFAALDRVPELAEVILNRGWEAEAREALMRLVDLDGPLPDPAVRALALIGGPAVQRRLIVELRRSPRVELYELLRRLSVARGELDQAVDRLWQARPVAFWAPDFLEVSVYEIALRHGRRKALAEVSRILRALAPESRLRASRLIGVLRRTVRLPTSIAANDDAAVCEWFIQHEPDQFRYDSNRQRWTCRTTVPKHGGKRAVAPQETPRTVAGRPPDGTADLRPHRLRHELRAEPTRIRSL